MCDKNVEGCLKSPLQVVFWICPFLGFAATRSSPYSYHLPHSSVTFIMGPQVFSMSSLLNCINCVLFFRHSNTQLKAAIWMWTNCRQAMANSTTNSSRQSSLQVQTQSIRLLQALKLYLVTMEIEPLPHKLQFTCLSRMLTMLSRHRNSNLSSKPNLFNMFSMSNLFSMSSIRNLLHFSNQEQNL